MEEDFLKMDLYEVSKFLRENTGKENAIFKKVFKRYGDIKVTNNELNNLKEDFFLEKIKLKLEDPLSQWETDQLEAYEIYKENLAKNDYSLQAEKNYLENKVLEFRNKYELSKKEYFQQSKICKYIKINLEEMIEKKAAFHNTLLILNNEMIDLSILISKEKEKQKLGINGNNNFNNFENNENANYNNNNEDDFENNNNGKRKGSIFSNNSKNLNNLSVVKNKEEKKGNKNFLKLFYYIKL